MDNYTLQQAKQEIMELKSAMVKIAEQLGDISLKVNDIHSKPEPVINRLILKEETKQSEEIKPLNLPNIAENYYYITRTGIFYYNAQGDKKYLKIYKDNVYIGEYPAKSYNLWELVAEYFPETEGHQYI
jgi:hypothetical protein